MTEALLAHEAAIRLAVFVAVLVLMAVLEATLPRRRRSVTRWARWPSNLGIVVLDAALLRLLLPATAAAVALVVEGQGAGLLPALGLPPWAMIVAAMVLLDLAVYLQHVLFHAVPGLWRLHRMHHADLDFDVTTGSRFHPVEILLSMAVKLAVIAAIGAPAAAVVLFEITLNATSMFNHANLRLPPALDRVLRWIVVTPDMHRVHHSIRRPETDSNYGFNLPWWDRVFGTYRAQPADGHDGMTIGLPVFRTVRDSRLDQLLLQPLRNPSAPGGGGSDGGDAGDHPL